MELEKNLTDLFSILSGRRALQRGAKVGEYDKYEIVEKFAEGASCLVYYAKYIDDLGAKHFVILKELYPDDGCCERLENGQIKWRIRDENERKEQFENACLSLNELENDPSGDIARHAQTTIDNFEANGTCYNVMTLSREAEVYSKYEGDKKIRDILFTVKALTKVVGKLHKMKLLHMDIKPENFAVEPVGNEKKITLFDVDSFAPTDESGRFKRGSSLSYSDGYCAPEVEANFAKICRASDLYSIGVVLFERIMERRPEPRDLEPAAVWDFPDEVFCDNKGNGLNPLVEKRVKQILECLLRAEPSGRFQTAEELQNRLKETIGLCEATYVRSNIGGALENFVGREGELEEIKGKFEAGKHTVVLRGVGGIGKTQLALKYWEQNQEKYDVGVCLDFRGGVHAQSQDFDALEDKLLDIELYNYTESSFKYKGVGKCEAKKRLETIKELLDKKGVLLYIDNFDVPNEESEIKEYGEIWKKLLNEFKTADILVTTRADLIELGGGAGRAKCGMVSIDLEAMDKDTAWEMFQNACQRRAAGDREAFDAFHDAVAGNTLALYIVGRLYEKDLRYSSLGKVLEDYQRQDLSGIKINLAMNDSEKAENALCRIYSLANLSKKYRDALFYVYFFHRTVLDWDRLCRIWEERHEQDKVLNALDKLVNWGWVTKTSNWSWISEKEAEAWTLHPLIVRMISKLPEKPDENAYFDSPVIFWMYFKVEAPFNIVEGKRETSYIRKLVSCFEPGDHLDKLVIPKDLPELFSILRTPFCPILVAQEKGYLGSTLEVEEGNPYYQSKSNCVFGKGEDKRLYLMSIENSEIPQDAGIKIIDTMACAHNKNEKVYVPASVSVICRNAFSYAQIRELYILGESKEIEGKLSAVQTGGSAFHRMSEESTIYFDRLPKGACSMFVDCAAKLDFNNRDIIEDSDCLVDNTTGELLGFHYMRRSSTGKWKKELRISNHVRRIDSVINSDMQSIRIILPSSIEYIETGIFLGVVCISMDGEGEYYTVVEGSLVRKADGAVLYAKADSIPKEPWITTLETKSIHAYSVRATVCVPDNIKIIKSAFTHPCGSLILPAGIEKIEALGLRFNVQTIEYQGTKEQWRAIAPFRVLGGLPSREFVIKCSDGDFVYSQEEIRSEMRWLREERERARQNKTE